MTLIDQDFRQLQRMQRRTPVPHDWSCMADRGMTVTARWTGESQSQIGRASSAGHRTATHLIAAKENPPDP
jgi:hypothetical protein